MEAAAKILIVDDDKEFVRATRTILESQNYSIDVAYNREDALDKLKKNRPDLLILDIMMDEIDDGFTICQMLKNDPELKNIPIFSLSAITEQTGIRYSPKYDKGFFDADDYAEKPIEAEELLERVNNLLTK